MFVLAGLLIAGIVLLAGMRGAYSEEDRASKRLSGTVSLEIGGGGLILLLAFIAPYYYSGHTVLNSVFTSPWHTKESSIWTAVVSLFVLFFGLGIMSIESGLSDFYADEASGYRIIGIVVSVISGTALLYSLYRII